jgi:hypothetical protein
VHKAGKKSVPVAAHTRRGKPIAQHARKAPAKTTTTKSSAGLKTTYYATATKNKRT